MSSVPFESNTSAASCDVAEGAIVVEVALPPDTYTWMLETGHVTKDIAELEIEGEGVMPFTGSEDRTLATIVVPPGATVVNTPFGVVVPNAATPEFAACHKIGPMMSPGPELGSAVLPLYAVAVSCVRPPNDTHPPAAELTSNLSTLGCT